ncbi:tail fiber assembly protein [Enterobacter sp. Lyrl_3]|uniref:tail fiber assembly protein n=1 Tax=Enterobacter sp. Lyrl_3 TaxID=3110922 RepID=UPI003F81DECF
MLNLKNFTEYVPSDDDKKELIEIYNAKFYVSEGGADWYESLSAFQEDTVKIKYRSDGVIISVATDASLLCPDGGSVAEVSSLPADFSINQWRFINGEIERVPIDVLAEANAEKLRLMSEAEATIAPLKRAAKYDMATDVEKQLLEEWEIYSVLLSRVDTSLAPDIEWPPVPD